ncbi:ketopantoate reductase family protein [Methylobacterium aerolatum]|uniref:2-dehydropantoate 2-reductase n=1 Tax=Methylobacterium aerolatum TaxID=418708 RepID=A0ABU0HY46_9HYPH|nr:ketopantoate reductase family protein [Methylobacterium aerolatum]MDQ0446414.1 2-dehydropantoate 2-reductase [Methylobacterium aerolatum]GJD33423.1 2-dehydropantoate 2-reductase [Methylobacterium aerolatum]
MTHSQSPRVAVMGAGAVGCYYGAVLAKAGHAVTLVGRPALVEAVGADGLILETAAGREAIRLGAVAGPEGVAGADLVLVCVKSGDTEAAGQSMIPHLAPGASVLSLQNGVDNGERLAAVIGRPVVPVAVYVATEMAGPGHVRHHGRGDLIVGTGGEDAAEVLIAAGVPVTVSERVRDALWTKLTVNCAWNALSALSGRPYGRLFAGEGIEVVLADAVAECQAVAAASGVRLPEDILTQVRAIAQTMAEQRSSTAQDLARGKRTEIDHLNGYVVREGERLGVPTPVNRVLHALVKLVE